jgi:hypothetical protein
MFIKAIQFISISLLSGMLQGLMAQGEPIIFSATGDVPYSLSEVPVFQQQIADHNLYSPAEFFVHLGDIKNGSSPCNESAYSSVAGYLMELAVPVFIVPGDNETTDCTDEVQAWNFWVQYFMDFELNFCGAPLAEKQTARPENFAFIRKGVLFIGINLPSDVSVPIQTDDADWVEQQLEEKVSQVRGAVIFSQVGPGGGESTFFNRFVPAAQTFAKPVLFLHGSGHSWIMDHPFSASNVLRVQVNDGGSEAPVQITVTMDTQNMFAFLRNPFSNNPPLYNMRPCVQAGSDQQITLAMTANLQGSVSDDGVPLLPATLSSTWSKTSGPGTVTFADPNNLVTSASFSFPGIYLIRLTADDGELQNFDELLVEVTDVLVEIKIFLEGPYTVSQGNMRTDLKDNGFIPVTSPYPADPRTVSSVPQDITDWVLVELRESPAGPAVASKSAFLRNDGRIVADDGATPIITMDVPANYYYIVIRQRNHLAVMSADFVQLSNNSSTLYDFTTGSNKFVGGDDGSMEIEPGIWGMISGDGNNDGGVYGEDYTLYQLNQGEESYHKADFNLDGGVYGEDYTIYQLNQGMESAVP